jgi:hypothetical protein
MFLKQILPNKIMIFDQMTGALYSNDGNFVKTVRCPLSLRPEQLERLNPASPDKHCNWCDKTIIAIDELSDKDIIENITNDRSICIFATARAKNVIFLKPIGLEASNYLNLPIIQTMRSLEAMSDAQEQDHVLIFKDTSEQFEFGEDKYIVYQHQLTGKLWWSGDYRSGSPMYENDSLGISDWKLIRDWFFTRPDRPFPLAAYAIPKDLHIGARVFLEDLIEDSFQEIWNQGNAQRRVKSPAKWNGKDLIVDPPEESMMTG